MQHQRPAAQASDKAQQKRPPVSQPQTQGNGLAVGIVPHESQGSGESPTARGQAAVLGDPRLHILQRQMLASDIGEVQGNGHLQQVLAFERRNSPTAPTSSLLRTSKTQASGDAARQVVEEVNAPSAELEETPGGEQLQAKPLGHVNSVQRNDDGGTGVGTRPRSVGATLARASLDDIRRQTTSRSFLLGAYTERGTGVAQKARSRMEQFGSRYQSAYQIYAGTISAARQEAQNQQQWIDVFAGIAIGVSVGLISEVLVGDAILTAAETVLVEVIGETSEAIAASGAKGMGVIPQVAGQELEPGGSSPDLINTQIWQTIARMYGEITRLQRVSWYLPLLLGNTEYALGQLRLLEAGVDADMPEADVIDMAVSLGHANSAIQPLDRLLTQKLAALDRLNARLDASPNYPTDEIEQDIWIFWMSSLPDSESDILDLDAIEDHLKDIHVLGGGSSRLGVDFGLWTSKSDELEALASARNKSSAIRTKIESMTGG